MEFHVSIRCAHWLSPANIKTQKRGKSQRSLGLVIWVPVFFTCSHFSPYRQWYPMVLSNFNVAWLPVLNTCSHRLTWRAVVLSIDLRHVVKVQGVLAFWNKVLQISVRNGHCWFIVGRKRLQTKNWITQNKETVRRVIFLLIGELLYVPIEGIFLIRWRHHSR